MKPILVVGLVSLVAAGCNSTQPANKGRDSLNIYTNSKYGYSVQYPSGYLVETFSSSDAGQDLPAVPAQPDSNPVTISKNGTPSWITIDVHVGALPVTDQNVANGYAGKPTVTKTEVANMPAYKLTFAGTPYELYIVQNTTESRTDIKIPTGDALSADMLKSFHFTK